MIRTACIVYLVFAGLAGPHICCLADDGASLLASRGTSTPAPAPCCPDAARHDVPPPAQHPAPCPCEEGRTPPSLYRIADQNETVDSVATSTLDVPFTEQFVGIP